MTCASSPTKFANLAGRVSGLSRLAGQRAFYAGLAVGVAGTLGVQQGMKRIRRRSASGFALTPSPPLRPIPALEGDPPKPKPRRIPALDANPPGTRDKPRPIPGLAASPAETKLKPESIQVRTGSGQVVAAPDSYRVMRPDGSDTGLAINPGLKVSQRNGVSQVVIEAGQWWLTHLASGKGLAGPYPTLEAAHRLAGILAQADWSRDESELTTREMEQLKETIKSFQTGEGLRNVNSRYSPFAHSPSPGNQSLEGKILADGRGGVARVLEDRGGRLFMMDSLGERYEIDRRETRPADESDFEMCRVAMSFDPTTRTESRCGSCNRSTQQTGAGEMWYRMSWQTFCETCARRHALEEGYAFEEEIGDSLELESR